MFQVQQQSGKRKKGCPSTGEWRSKDTPKEELVVSTKVNQLLEQTSDQRKNNLSGSTTNGLTTTGLTNSIENTTKSRSSLRIQNFWKRLKLFRKYMIASINTRNNDTKPFMPITIDERLYFALLDSGANKTVIGGELSRKIQELPEFKKCYEDFRTADGQIQKISGIATVKFIYQGGENIVSKFWLFRP